MKYWRDDHTHQAHIDHLLPGPGKVKQPAGSTPAIASPKQPATSPETESDSTVVPLSPPDLDSSNAGTDPQLGISYVTTNQESSPPSTPH